MVKKSKLSFVTRKKISSDSVIPLHHCVVCDTFARFESHIMHHATLVPLHASCTALRVAASHLQQQLRPKVNTQHLASHRTSTQASIKSAMALVFRIQQTIV
jgi:hypothetical protein